MEYLIQKFLKENNLTGVNGINYTLRDDGRGVYIEKWLYNIAKPVFTAEDFANATIEVAKQSKLVEIKVKRDEALNKNITFDGKTYKGTENARTLYFNRYNSNKFPIDWRCADDITWVSLTSEKALGLYNAFFNDSATIYQKETTLIIALNNSKSPDDINKIIVNY